MNHARLDVRNEWMFATITSLVVVFAGQSTVFAQGKHRPDDRVECEVTGNPNGKYWEKGTVMGFRANDQPDGSWYRVRADSNKVEYYCRVEHIRPISGTQGVNEQRVAKAEAPARRSAQKAEMAAAGDFVECPVKQNQARNGSRPDADLLKRIVRCAKGEKPVSRGDEGAVKVDVSALQIGASRPWSYRQDSGNGQASTVVYPVKVTYTVKTLYRRATEVSEGWIRILNVYVNAFGEWQIGSEEPVASPKNYSVPN